MSINIDDKDFSLDQVQKYLDEQREKLNQKIKEQQEKNNQLQTQLDESNDKIKEYEQKNNNLTNEIEELDNKLFQQENEWQDKINEMIEKNNELENRVNIYKQVEISFNKTVRCANILKEHVNSLNYKDTYIKDVSDLKNIKLKETKIPDKITIYNINFFLILIGKMMACCSKYHIKFQALKYYLNETYVCKYEQFEVEKKQKKELDTVDKEIQEFDTKAFDEICTEILKKQKEEEEEMEKRKKIQREKEEEMRAMKEKMKNRNSLKF